MTHAEQADFVKRFEEVWANPSPDGLLGLLHPDGRLVQPVEGEVNGHAEARGMWDRLFALIPDVRGEVLRWAGSEDLLLIEVRLYGTLGGKPIEWVSADLIRLEDGLARERIARFDPTPLLAAGLRSPRVWPQLVRGRVDALRR